MGADELKLSSAERIDVPRIAFAAKTDVSPVIGGKSDDLSWGNRLDGNFLPADTKKTLKKQSALSLCYDDKNLYVKLECQAPDVAKIKKGRTIKDDDIWKDDCVEIFLMPRTNEYFHIIVTAANARDISRAVKQEGDDGVFDIKPWQADWQSAVTMADGKWIVTMALPFDALGVSAPSNGSVWKGNFCREEQEFGENSSYFRTSGWFHDTSLFGDIVFDSHAGNLSPVLRNDIAGLEKQINYVQDGMVKNNNPELIVRLDKAKEKVENIKAMLPEIVTGKEEYRKIKSEIIRSAKDVTGIVCDYERIEKDRLFDSYARKYAYLLWRKNPLAALARDKIPIDVKEDVKEVNMVMGRNEIEMCSLVIANFKERALAGRVVVSRFRDGKGNLLAPDFISLKGTAFIELKGNKFVDDPLPALNEVNEIVALPRENKEVILFVDSWKLQSGTYSGIIDVRPYEGTNSFPVKTIRLNISVLPVDLGKDHLRLQVFEMGNYIWVAEKLRDFKARIDEFKISREMWPEYIRDMAAHRVNVFRPVENWVPYPVIDKDSKKIKEPLDPARLPFFDYMLDLYKKYGKEGTIVNVCPYQVDKYIEARGLEYSSPEWKDALSVYFKALIEHLKSRGFNEDDLTFYVYDEINADMEKRVKPFCEVSKIIKEVDPKAKIFLTLSPTTEAKVIESVAPAAPYVDVWCAYITIVKSGYFKLFKDTGKPIWSYANGGYSTQTGSPLNIEKYGWLAWDKGIQGIGSWSYNCWISDSWDDFDNFHPDPITAKRSAEAYVYRGPKGPVTSRRWEAMREAMEDHELLYSLNSAIEKAKEAKKDVAVSQKLLSDALGKVLNCNDPDILYGYKTEILKEIVRLQNR